MIVKTGQSLAAYYRIELCLRLILNFGEQEHREKEGMYSRGDL